MSIIVVHQKRSALILPNVQYVGRPTELGNPFTHLTKKTLAEFQVSSVNEAVTQYGYYFYSALMTQPSCRQRLRQLINNITRQLYLTDINHQQP